MKEEIREKILESVALVLRIDSEKMKNVNPDAVLNAVGMDSLNCVEIVVSIEDEFNISFNDDELLVENINTINKLTAIVEQKLS